MPDEVEWSEEGRDHRGDPGSLRSDAQPSVRSRPRGCAPNTVARCVQAREAGGLRATLVQRSQLIDAFREKIEEWGDASHGRIRADLAQRVELAQGDAGSGCTTRGQGRAPLPLTPAAPSSRAAAFPGSALARWKLGADAKTRGRTEPHAPKRPQGASCT